MPQQTQESGVLPVKNTFEQPDISSRTRRVLTDNRVLENLSDEQIFQMNAMLESGRDPLLNTAIMESLSDETVFLIDEVAESIFENPEDRIADPLANLKAIQDGILKESELPVTGEGPGMFARGAASFGVTPGEKVNIYKQYGLNAEALPSGEIVIKNVDGTISSVNTPNLEMGDLTDLTGPFVESAPAVAGGIVGSVGGPVGAIEGSAVGAGVGSLARLGIGNLLGADTDFGEGLGRVATDVALDASLTLGMMGAGGLLKSVGKNALFTESLEAPFKNVIDLESMRMRPMFKAEGADLPITSLTESPLVGIMRGGSARTLGGTEIIAAEDRLAEEALLRIVKDYSSKVTPKGSLDRSAIGAFAHDGFALARKGFQGEAGQRFDALLSKIGDDAVRPTKAVAYLQEILEGHGLIDSAGKPTRQVSPMKSSGLELLLKDFNHLKRGKFTYKMLKVERTLTRRKGKGDSDVSEILQGLESALTDDMLDNASRIATRRDDMGLIKEVIDLNQWYRQKKTLFDGSDVSKIFKNDDPSQVVKKLFSGNNVDRIKRAKEALDPVHFDFMARQWLDDIVTKSTKSTEFQETFNPVQFANHLRTAGDDVVSEAFGKKAQFLFDIRDAGLALQRGKSRQVTPLITASWMRDILKLITHPIEGAFEVVKGSRTAKALVSEEGKNFATTGATNSLLKGLATATSPAGQGIRGLGEMLKNSAPLAPSFPFLLELLSKQAPEFQSAPSDATNQ